LYRLDTDPGESNNLRKQAPEKYEELLEEWYSFADETRLQLPR
jgi:hypothetical protein